MITLSKGGAYLIGGTEVVETGAGSEELLKNKLGDKYLTKEDAAKNTMAYRILNEHNTSYYICWNHSDSKSFRIRKIPNSLCAYKLS